MEYTEERMERCEEEARRLIKEKLARINSDIEHYHQSLDESKKKYAPIELPIALDWNTNSSIVFKVPHEIAFDDPNYTDIPEVISFFTEYFKEHISPWYSETIPLSDLMISSYIGKDEYLDFIRNGLPQWEDSDYKTLPEESLERITSDFTVTGKIAHLLSMDIDYYAKKLDIRRKEFDETVLRIEEKFHKSGTLTKQELKFIDVVVGKDIKKLFPADMSEKQIVSAVKQAYKRAKVVSAEDITENDIKALNYISTRRKLLFEGNSNDLVIRFWYDLDECAIYTAYLRNDR